MKTKNSADINDTLSPPTPPESPLPDGFSPALLDWFRAHQRDLPWRRDMDPYAIWVSEIMLQQTQVATVIPYFERFMARFPTLRDLAEAPEEEVMRLWAGLGYYSRARNLRRGAQEVLERFEGRVPSRVEDLLTLKGIGRYTAGAIASIAYNERAPLLDGNVMRVLCRVFALPGDPKRGPLHRRLWELAEALIPDGYAREFNPALMELGATICTPRSPRCGACPVSDFCEAFRRGEQERYPEAAPQRPQEQVQMVCGVIVREDDGRVLLVQPATEGRWGGLWQLPNAPLGDGEGYRERLARLLDGMGLEAGTLQPVTEVRHGITRFSITLQAFECRCEGAGEPQPGSPSRWSTREELMELPLPAPHRRVVKAWLAGVKAELPSGRQLSLDLSPAE
ncbi:MAG: A/G-specific adenine glycosylase [Armatimonadetes bacterium]|nr:A/G-specific adenine glycosylase [Armatimonadota bacterium]